MERRRAARPRGFIHHSATAPQARVPTAGETSVDACQRMPLLLAGAIFLVWSKAPTSGRSCAPVSAFDPPALATLGIRAVTTSNNP